MKNNIQEFTSEYKSVNLIIKGFKKEHCQIGLDQRFHLHNKTRLMICKWNGDEETNLKTGVDVFFYYR